MTLQNFLTVSLLIISGFFISVSAQEKLSTFSMKFDGRTAEVTQDIDAKFLGEYIEGDGLQAVVFNLSQNESQSFCLKQARLDPFAEELCWDKKRSTKIKWGLLVKNGEIAVSTVHKFENGHAQKYEAFVFIFQNLETKEYSYLTLYEEGGQIFLGEASKTNEFGFNG